MNCAIALLRECSAPSTRSCREAGSCCSDAVRGCWSAARSIDLTALLPSQGSASPSPGTIVARFRRGRTESRGRPDDHAEMLPCRSRHRPPCRVAEREPARSPSRPKRAPRGAERRPCRIRQSLARGRPTVMRHRPPSTQETAPSRGHGPRTRSAGPTRSSERTPHFCRRSRSKAKDCWSWSPVSHGGPSNSA
jgi:hypothetical protein